MTKMYEQQCVTFIEELTVRHIYDNVWIIDILIFLGLIELIKVE